MEAICFPCRNGLVPDQPDNCASCLHEIIRFHVKHDQHDSTGEQRSTLLDQGRAPNRGVSGCASRQRSMSWAHCDYFHRRHLAIAFGIFCNHTCRPTRSPLSSARQQQGRGGVPVDSHNHILDDAQISIASSDHQAPGLPDPVSRETTPLSHDLSSDQGPSTAFTEDATNEVKMLFNFSLRCRDEETRNVLFSCPIPKPSCARASMWRHPSSF